MGQRCLRDLRPEPVYEWGSGQSCQLPYDHAGPCQDGADRCPDAGGTGNGGDIRCDRERGHRGPHRMEWH